MNDCCKQYQDKIAETVLFLLEQSKQTRFRTEAEPKAIILCAKLLTERILELCFNCSRPLTRTDNNQLVCLGCNRQSPLE